MKIKDQLWIWVPTLLVLGFIGYNARTNQIRLHYMELKNEVGKSYTAEFGYTRDDFGEVIANEAIVENDIKHKDITKETVRDQKLELAKNIENIKNKYEGIINKLNDEERAALTYWWMPIR